MFEYMGEMERDVEGEVCVRRLHECRLGVIVEVIVREEKRAGVVVAEENSKAWTAVRGTVLLCGLTKRGRGFASLAS